MGDVQDELMELRGLRFHYRDWKSGTPNAPDLVLLHGYTGHARSWDAFAEAMAGDYRVLALDQRGHGQSDWAPPDEYGTLQMVDDLKAFVAALGLEQYVLLGLSMGGITAISYAGQQPAELARLVIVDIGPETIRRGSERIVSNQGRPDVFDTFDDMFAQARADNDRPPEAHHRDRVRNNAMRTDAGGWTYRYDRALRDVSNIRPRPSVEEGWTSVANIDVPTLLIRGEHSDILDSNVAERMLGEISDCAFVEVEDSGHAVPLDRPDAFLNAVKTFL